jgi:hypothetical protein
VTTNRRYKAEATFPSFLPSFLGASFVFPFVIAHMSLAAGGGGGGGGNNNSNNAPVRDDDSDDDV